MKYQHIKIIFAIIISAIMLTAFQCGRDEEPSIVGSWKFKSCQEYYYNSWPAPYDTIKTNPYPPLRDVLFEAGGKSNVEIMTIAEVFPPAYYNCEDYMWTMSDNNDTVFLNHQNHDELKKLEIVELTPKELVVRFTIYRAGPEAGGVSVYTSTYRRK